MNEIKVQMINPTNWLADITRGRIKAKTVLVGYNIGELVREYTGRGYKVVEQKKEEVKVWTKNL